MFQMTVENVIRINGNISFGGSCKNRNEFTNLLMDEFGNTYDAYEPLGKDLVFDDSHITLCLRGVTSVDSLKGRVLKGIAANIA